MGLLAAEPVEATARLAQDRRAALLESRRKPKAKFPYEREWELWHAAQRTFLLCGDNIVPTA
jgi:hypothetical protein